MLEIRLRIGGGRPGWDFRHHRAVRAVELGGPLSLSRLWELQRQRALSDGTVGVAPLARVRALAEVIRAWRGGGKLDVLEIGASSIRPGLALCEALGEGARVLVTTDHAASLARWRGDPTVHALGEAGRLWVGAWDPLRERPPDAIGAAPLVVISHGYLEWTPADLLKLEDGAIYEGLIEVSAATSVPDPPRPKDVHRLRLRVSWRADDAPYRDHPWLTPLVEGYRRALDGVVVPIPRGALTVLERLRAVAPGPLLVLAAEDGDATLGALARVVPTDGLSPRVNLHALGRYADASWLGRAHDGTTPVAWVFGGASRGAEAAFRAAFGDADREATVAEAWRDVLSTRDLRALGAIDAAGLAALPHASGDERAAIGDALDAIVSDLLGVRADALDRLAAALRVVGRAEAAAQVEALARRLEADEPG